jgi:hypothetical protein
MAVKSVSKVDSYVVVGKYCRSHHSYFPCLTKCKCKDNAHYAGMTLNRKMSENILVCFTWSVTQFVRSAVDRKSPRSPSPCRRLEPNVRGSYCSSEAVDAHVMCPKAPCVEHITYLSWGTNASLTEAVVDVAESKISDSNDANPKHTVSFTF